MAAINMAFTSSERNGDGGGHDTLTVDYGSVIIPQKTKKGAWLDAARNCAIVALLCGLCWSCLYLVTHGEVLPPGGLFQLLCLFVLAKLGGYITGFLRLPPLLGMLIAGVLLKSAGYFHLQGVYPDLVIISRNLALSVILLKAGFGLDSATLAQLKFTVLKLAALPCIFEACAAAVAANIFLQVPWLWGFLIGFVLSPISPAVVVPTLLALKEEGYGEDKGIATLVIASSSIDDILSISVFGVIMASIFTPGGDMTMSLLQGPLELVGGLAVGCIWGCVVGFIPMPTTKEWKLSGLLCFGGFVAVVGSIEFEVSGAGPLAAITSAFVANILWTKRAIPVQEEVSHRLTLVWGVVQPALFGLIGAEVDLTQLEPSLILNSLIILAFSLAVRLVVCYVCLVGIGLNWKEMLFVNLAWLPKATVQAALGPQPLGMLDPADPQVPVAKLLLTTAVLAIIITAPLGAVGISLTGPKLLSKPDNYI